MWKEMVEASFGVLVQDLTKRNWANEEEVPDGLILNQESVPGLPELDIFSARQHGAY